MTALLRVTLIITLIAPLQLKDGQRNSNSYCNKKEQG